MKTRPAAIIALFVLLGICMIGLFNGEPYTHDAWVIPIIVSLSILVINSTD